MKAANPQPVNTSTKVRQITRVRKTDATGSVAKWPGSTRFCAGKGGGRLIGSEVTLGVHSMADVRLASQVAKTGWGAVPITWLMRERKTSLGRGARPSAHPLRDPLKSTGMPDFLETHGLR